MRDLAVHEWIEKSGGSEMVFDQIVAARPDADIFCLWKDDENRYSGRSVTESWMSRTPLRRSKALALPLMHATWSHVDTSSYDRVLVSSHLFAHHIGGRPGRHRADQTFVYVHTPARYIWTPELDKRGSSFAVRAGAAALKPVDHRAAGYATGYAANSEFVKQRIADTWHQDSTVIYPPVNVSKITDVPVWADTLTGDDLRVFESLPRPFVLGASRFVPYKELDKVIDAGVAAGVAVVLAGSGPERAALEAHAEAASVPVVFVEHPSDALLYSLYQAALVYVFPAVEDFGIMPVEAMAAGARVIVGDVGGAIESVIDGQTGVQLGDWSRASLADAVSTASALDARASVARAWEFDAATFRKNYLAWIDTP